MSRTRRELTFIGMGLLLIASGSAVVSTITTKTTTKPNPNDFLPSGTNSSFASVGYSSFSDYVAATTNIVEHHLVPISQTSRADEIRFATPYQLEPQGDCAGTNPLRGVLLLHGLGDTPTVMDSLASYFVKQCFLVRALLLPGHGTRPADLLTTSRRDWVASVNFAIETLRVDVDGVYVAGFSLGGLLAINAAIDHPDIKGIFAFSAPLKTGYYVLLSQTIWLRHVRDWLDKDPRDDPARYDSMPMNGVAETVLLGQEVSAELKKQALDVPVFLTQSADDKTIDTDINRSFFHRAMASEHSRLIVYRRQAQNPKPPNASRVVEVDSYLPEQKIYSYSHRAIHVAPDHPHYGLNQAQRNCGASAANVPKKMVERCENSRDPWRGERVGADLSELESLGAFERLSFNPKWRGLTQLMTQFIARSSMQASSKTCQQR